MSPPSPQSLNTAKFVLTAIGDLRDEGVSKDELRDYIETEFSVPNKEVGKHLSRALERGIAFGAIKKFRGRYYLGDAVEGVREHRRRRSKGRKGHKGGRRRRRRRRRHH